MGREEMLALVKEVAAEEDLSNRKYDVITLKKEADRLIKYDPDSLADQDYCNAFMKYYNEIASREVSLNTSAYDEKKAIIEKAKTILNETNFKKANEELNAIFDEFKAAARCSKEQDDALWAEIKEVRDTFNANRKAYFDNLKEGFEAKKNAKEEIINKAKALLENTNFKEAMPAMNALLEDWKKVGYSGKESDDALWAEFSAARKEFFEKKNQYFADLKKKFEEKVAQKEELIKKAKQILANSEFTEEEVNEIKGLRQSWKEIGFSGKDKDDELWAEFNDAINSYFKEKRFYNKVTNNEN